LPARRKGRRETKEKGQKQITLSWNTKTRRGGKKGSKQRRRKDSVFVSRPASIAAELAKHTLKGGKQEEGKKGENDVEGEKRMRGTGEKEGKDVTEDRTNRGTWPKTAKEEVGSLEKKRESEKHKSLKIYQLIWKGVVEGKTVWGENKGREKEGVGFPQRWKEGEQMGQKPRRHIPPAELTHP